MDQTAVPLSPKRGVRAQHRCQDLKRNTGHKEPPALYAIMPPLWSIAICVVDRNSCSSVQAFEEEGGFTSQPGALTAALLDASTPQQDANNEARI